MPSDNNSNSTDSLTPAEKKAKDVGSQSALAMELPFTLVGAIVVAGAVGHFLDRWLHTRPIFMLVLGGLGFVAGVREVLRRLPGK